MSKTSWSYKTEILYLTPLSLIAPFLFGSIWFWQFWKANFIKKDGWPSVPLKILTFGKNILSPKILGFLLKLKAKSKKSSCNYFLFTFYKQLSIFPNLHSERRERVTIKNSLYYTMKYGLTQIKIHFENLVLTPTYSICFYWFIFMQFKNE